MQLVRLNNGIDMPMLGLGTFLSGPGEEAQRAVGWALEAGYRLIDTALAYGNEGDVAAALRASGLAREEVFITSKLENDDQGFRSTLEACERSLRNLNTDYLDLYLVHWPVERLRIATWEAMERLLADGKCRAVGVSNYTERHLREVLNLSDIVPAVNQVEFHPFLHQRELLAYCRGRGIQLQAYSPLAKARRLDHPVFEAIGARHGKTAAQVMLRWHLDHGVPAIPKSVHRDWIRENMEVWDFELSEDELRRLDDLNEFWHTDWDPTHAS